MRTFVMIGVAAVGATMMVAPCEAQTAGAFMTNPAFQGPRPARCTSTVQLQHCAAADLRIADAQMAAQYKALSATLRPAARQSLLSEQRAWLKSRDRNCLAKGRGGGSIASINVAQCWVEVTRARAGMLGSRLPKGTAATTLPASAFVGRWRGGEGTTMKISHQGTGFIVDNQWGLDKTMHGVFRATLSAAGLHYRREGVVVTVTPSAGDKIDRSALRGKKDCLRVSSNEGYCRY